VSFVRTVLGDIRIEDMGFTLPHEHLLVHAADPSSPDFTDQFTDSVDKVVEMLSEFRNDGGCCVVETTPENRGRDAEGLYAASQQSQVHILACTGYFRKEGETQSDKFDLLEINQMAEYFIRDIEEGMDDTEIRAGWVKAGTGSSHMTPLDEKVLRAAARASLETGTCLHVHSSLGTMGLEQIAIAESEGLDPGNMIIAHTDRIPDVRYHRKLLSRGVFLIYDSPGHAGLSSDAFRIDLLKQLASEGYSGQLMVSNDMDRKKHHRVYGYGPGFTWIKDCFLPLLLEAGLSMSDVDNFMVYNPARAYSLSK